MTTDKLIISNELQAIVEEFNTKFAEWMGHTGCRATFGWTYGPDRATPKAMEITAIDLIVYRKKPPEFSTMAAVMEKGEPKV